MMILIAGPYRSGTGDDPLKMAANVRAMEELALPLFRAGHLPVVGEWYALPLVSLAGSHRVGDAAFDEIFHPIAVRILARCDAVLRVGGPSQGADQMVAQARDQGLKVFYRLQDVPGCEHLPDPPEATGQRDGARLPAELEAQVAELSARYGQPARVLAELPDGVFDPLTKLDRIGEACMVIRRRSGNLLTFRKDIYPQGVMRLLTGGVNPGERIEDGLLREVSEETSLEVAVRRFLAMIVYRTPQTPPDSHAFLTFAFLLDELGGDLTPQDPEERVEAYGETTVAGLYELATYLEGLDDHLDRAIGGSWRAWGIFRAVVHRVVADQLANYSDKP
jgi:ADP-ribose pyrophosphatase YjhB (NUDIX family)